MFRLACSIDVDLLSVSNLISVLSLISVSIFLVVSTGIAIDASDLISFLTVPLSDVSSWTFSGEADCVKDGSRFCWPVSIERERERERERETRERERERERQERERKRE